MISLLKKLRNDSGQVAVILALSIIPIFGVAGFAIDFQNTVKQKQRVQVILDSAVLAAARAKQSGRTDADIRKTVQDYVIAQMAPSATGLDCNAATVLIDDEDDSITAQVVCAQATSLTRVIGNTKMDFSVDSKADYGIDKVDVAFMFDISGSMNGRSRLQNLKAAAKEAVDVLLPADASPELIENTRIAMVSYNTMVNAGEYFEAVTGVPATRTYTHTIKGGSAVVSDEGDLLKDIDVTLMDADRTREISKLGDDAVVAIEEWGRNNKTQRRLSVDISVPSSSPYHGKFKSVRMDLRGRERHSQTENARPYALYGDRRNKYHGRNWREGDFTLRIRLYSEQRARGRKIFDKTIKFEIGRSKDSAPIEKTYTVRSTCVWERDGSEKFTDGAPRNGAYLAHQQAWFVEDSNHRDGGRWYVGHPNRSGHYWYRGSECGASKPIGLTNNRATLNNYVNSLRAGGGTAGHLGVAWSWYLVSEYWGGVFTGTKTPLAYNEPDSDKVVILMTDGAFNAEIFPQQGRSDAQARALCDNMKRAGVKVYAVALNAPTSGKRVLSYCATNGDYFYEPETAAELTEAYKQIATSISDLRISQ